MKKHSAQKHIIRAIGQLSFGFETVVTLYDGPTAWYFCHLPIELSRELDGLFADQKRGFGSLPVQATLNGVTWQTSIFPESTSKTYMLPLKAQVRKDAVVAIGDKIHLDLLIAV